MPRHRVLIGFPGPSLHFQAAEALFCASEGKHDVEVSQSGFGLWGSFNSVWADALNAYEKGECTHFAMLHSDIAAQHGWLDVLLEEMDRLGADIVSAVVPIKDARGLTSTAIGDPDDLWNPFRRLTMREVFSDWLPETFSVADCGYPDKPLVVNDGCMVVDLRNPLFRAIDESGRARCYFGFPSEVVRRKDKWDTRWESEDWFFSRRAADLGAKIYATRRVKLRHLGDFPFPGNEAWGRYHEGDADAAPKWRPRPLQALQIVEFELGRDCNLGAVHTACPNRHPERFAALDTSRPLDDDAIVAAAVTAYRDLGFTGLVGWIYYNEPLLQADRMFRLMDRIKAEAPTARFLLWTNGTLIPEACDAYQAFEQIVVSRYDVDSQRGVDRLAARGIAAKVIAAPRLDSRLLQLDPPDAAAPCLRPFVELIFDHFGNSHLCCYDWRGEATLGNLHTGGITPIAAAWRGLLPRIAGRSMQPAAPAACRRCGHRWDRYQEHDTAIVNRARLLREGFA